MYRGRASGDETALQVRRGVGAARPQSRRTVGRRRASDPTATDSQRRRRDRTHAGPRRTSSWRRRRGRRSAGVDPGRCPASTSGQGHASNPETTTTTRRHCSSVDSRMQQSLHALTHLTRRPSVCRQPRVAMTTSEVSAVLAKNNIAR